jgi:hypothetical protein
MIFRSLILGLFIAAVLAVPAVAAPNDGNVTGTLVNKSAGGSVPGGAQVVLVAFGRKEQAPVNQQTTQTDAQGNYAFSGLDRDPNLVYITLARYQNVNYPADQPFQLQDSPNYRADITIYDSTTSDDAIQFERLNLLVMGAQDGMLQFMEMGALTNTGDRTFVTANPQDGALARAIKLALPAGALSVQMQTGFSNQDVTAGVGGIQITSPVPPGQHEFALSFQMPYSGSTADVSMQMPYPTAAYTLYLPDTGLQLDASGLTPGGPAQLGGQNYSVYSANNLARSTMVGALVKLSGSNLSGTLVNPSQLAFISLGVLVFVLGAGVLLFGGRFRPAAASGSVPSGNTETERLELIVRLAALDERFAAGEIGQNEYELERDRGKQRLRDLTRARREPAASTV